MVLRIQFHCNLDHFQFRDGVCRKHPMAVALTHQCFFLFLSLKKPINKQTKNKKERKRREMIEVYSKMAVPFSSFSPEIGATRFWILVILIDACFPFLINKNSTWYHLKFLINAKYKNIVLFSILGDFSRFYDWIYTLLKNSWSDF